jgi:PAS domain S-box-containing protein
MIQSTAEFSKTDVEDTAEKTPIRVLHVDDDAGFLKTAKAILEMQGAFQVDTVSSVEEAIEKMEKEKYDVVICDYQMPGKDGLEFLKELREKGNAVPFIVFTGKGREEVAMRALNLGADQYLNKIGDAEVVYGELAHSIRRFVEKREAERQVLYQMQLMQNVSDAIIASDENFVLASWNEAAEKMYGWKANEVIGRLGTDVLQTEFVAVSREQVIQTLRETGRFSCELIQLHRDGHRINIETIALGLRDENNQIVGYVSVNRDITERKKAEKALFAERDRLETVTRSIGAGLAIISKDYRTLWANDAVKQIFGDVEGKTCYSTYNQRNDICPECGVQQIFETGKAKVVHEQVGKDAEGKTIWSEITATPVKDRDGNIIAVLELVVPITERKKTEEEIRSLARFPSENPSPVLRIAKDGIITYANAAATFLLSKLKTKIGQPAPQPWCRLVTDALNSGLRKEIEVEHRDRVFLFTLTPVTGNAYVNVYGLDVADLKKAKVVLWESEERFRAIVENAPFGYYRVGKDGLWQYVNPMWERMHGLSLEEVVGKSFEITQTEDSVEQAKEYVKRALAGETIAGEFGRLTGEGDIEYHSFNIQPVKRNNEIVAIEGFINDISERKKALERLRVLNEKLGVVGKLTGHDVRNKLFTVTNNIYLAKQLLPDDHKALAYLREIESACGQTTRILDFAATYESLGVEQLALVDMGKAVEEAASLFSDLQDVKVVNECHGLGVMADSLLRQLLQSV